jgi:hypothetical protein
MAKRTPRITDGVLAYEADGQHQEIMVGSDAWFAWLRNARLFAFVHGNATVTVRKEERSGRGYWYAYGRRDGKLRRAYLGKGRLTLPQLTHAGVTLIAPTAARHPSQTDINASPLDLSEAQKQLAALKGRVTRRGTLRRDDAHTLLALTETLLDALQHERDLTARAWGEIERYLHEAQQGVQQRQPQLYWQRQGSDLY